MKFQRFIIRLSWILIALGFSLSLIGALLLGASGEIKGQAPKLSRVNCVSGAACDRIQYTTERRSASGQVDSAAIYSVPITPTVSFVAQLTTTTIRRVPPTPYAATESDEINLTTMSRHQTGRSVEGDASQESNAFAIRLTPVVNEASDRVAPEVYTSTDQVRARIDERETVDVELISETGCPVNSTAHFDLIPIEGPPAGRPDFKHADLNITLRGYVPVSESLATVFYSGNADAGAPQLSGLFQPNRGPAIKRAYQVNQWIWEAAECGSNGDGCPGPPITDWGVTLIGLVTTPGEAIYPPERGANIYGGGFKTLVLYAAEQQITLGYTRRNTVATGYAVHIEGVCVDPNLLALYRAQQDANGRHATWASPALHNDQKLGIALDDELKVAIRDNGSFLDPRSSKDWWQGY